MIMINVEEPAKGFIRITDENYDPGKYDIVERFLRNLDYLMIVDFKINFNVELILHESQLYVSPNNKESNFLESLKSIEDIKNTLESIKDREVSYSFELLVMKEGDFE